MCQSRRRAYLSFNGMSCIGGHWHCQGVSPFLALGVYGAGTAVHIVYILCQPSHLRIGDDKLDVVTGQMLVTDH